MSTSQTETFTVNEALETIGFGPYQWKMMLITGLIWVADANEIMISSIISPLLHCKWSLSMAEASMVSTSTLIGMFIGGPFVGKIVDIYGRKKVITMCLSFGLCCGLLSSASLKVYFLIITRCSLGIFLNTIYQAHVLLMEYTTKNKRSFVSAMMMIPWTVGMCFTVILAIFIIPDYGWRPWIILTNIPLLLALISNFGYPESLRYYSNLGEKEKLRKTLKSIQESNGRNGHKDLLDGDLIVVRMQERGNFLDLLNKKYRTITIFASIYAFSINVVYFGIIFLQSTTDSISETSKGSKLNCRIFCETDNKSFYYPLLYSSASEIIGTFLQAIFIDRIGRRNLFSLCMFLSSLMLAVLFIVSCSNVTVGAESIYFTIVFSTTRALVSPLVSFIVMYTSELYASNLRATAVGCIMMTGKLGAILGPMIGQSFYSLYGRSAYLVLIAFSLIASMIVRMLPETANTCLEDA